MHSARELEAKFQADDAALKRLLTLKQFGGFRLVEHETKVQNDLYYDTSDGHLKDAGASLRIRRKTSGIQMTFKGERQTLDGTDGHVVSRIEDEVDVDADVVVGLSGDEPRALSEDPSPLRRGRQIAGERALVPTARLTTERAVLLFENSHGQRVEIAVDRCRAVRLADGREVEFAEVELELKNGDVDVLVDAVEALQGELPGLTPSTMTKLQRALE